jgi:Fe-S-cluster-containing hydrogenase component 2
MIKFNPKLFGYPQCTKEKCVKCGECVEACPYNVLSISVDIEDGFPVFDRSKCIACGRCFNLCPQEAIEIPRIHTELRTRIPAPCFDPLEKKSESGVIIIPMKKGIPIIIRAFLGQTFLKILLSLVLILLIFSLKH